MRQKKLRRIIAFFVFQAFCLSLTQYPYLPELLQDKKIVDAAAISPRLTIQYPGVQQAFDSRALKSAGNDSQMVDKTARKAENKPAGNSFFPFRSVAVMTAKFLAALGGFLIIGLSSGDSAKLGGEFSEAEEMMITEDYPGFDEIINNAGQRMTGREYYGHESISSFGMTTEDGKNTETLLNEVKKNNDRDALKILLEIIRDERNSPEIRIELCKVLSASLVYKSKFIWGRRHDWSPIDVKVILPNPVIQSLFLNELADLSNAADETIRREAIKELRYHCNQLVLKFRNAHLNQGISNGELERMVTERFNNNPKLLYAAYTSPELFSDLANMIFDKLNTRAKSGHKGLYSFIKEIDPRGIFRKDFILQAANFSHLNTMLSSPASVFEIMDELFKNSSSEDIKNYSARLALFVETITADTEFKYQDIFQNYLKELYNQSRGLNKYLIAALLSAYKDDLKFLNPEDIFKIGKTAGIKPSIGADIISYDKLFKKSILTVHIIFADTDAVRDHYASALNFFQGKDFRYPDLGGYQEIDSSENRVTLQKGAVRLVLIKASGKEYDINQYTEEVGVIISRSHAGNTDGVFKKQNPRVNSNGKIFLVSACRSVSVAGGIAYSYPGANLIAINKTAYGDSTNIVTYYLLEALQKRVSGFREVKRFIEPHLKKKINDYLFPVDRPMVVQAEINDALSSENISNRRTITAYLLAAIDIVFIVWAGRFLKKLFQREKNLNVKKIHGLTFGGNNYQAKNMEMSVQEERSEITDRAKILSFFPLFSSMQRIDADMRVVEQAI